VAPEAKVRRSRSQSRLLAESRQGSGGADPSHAMYDKKLNPIPISLYRVLFLALHGRAQRPPHSSTQSLFNQGPPGKAHDTHRQAASGAAPSSPAPPSAPPPTTPGSAEDASAKRDEQRLAKRTLAPSLQTPTIKSLSVIPRLDRAGRVSSAARHVECSGWPLPVHQGLIIVGAPRDVGQSTRGRQQLQRVFGADHAGAVGQHSPSRALG
jgi:hypothetical protein